MDQTFKQLDHIFKFTCVQAYLRCHMIMVLSTTVCYVYSAQWTLYNLYCHSTIYIIVSVSRPTKSVGYSWLYSSPHIWVYLETLSNGLLVKDCMQYVCKSQWFNNHWYQTFDSLAGIDASLSKWTMNVAFLDCLELY